jgi:hypothetical protein
MKTILFFSAILFSLTLHQASASAGKNEQKTTKSKPATICKTSATMAFQSNIFQNAQGRVSVIVLDTEPTPITLQVFDGASNVLFTKELQEDSVRQDIQMKELESGQYTIALSRNGECFTKTVTVK